MMLCLIILQHRKNMNSISVSKQFTMDLPNKTHRVQGKLDEVPHVKGRHINNDVQKDVIICCVTKFRISHLFQDMHHNLLLFCSKHFILLPTC